MSPNLEYRTRERQRKRESRLQASETQQEKGDRDLGREIKKTNKQTNKLRRYFFFVGRTTKKFCSGGDKMRNASIQRPRMQDENSKRQ